MNHLFDIAAFADHCQFPGSEITDKGVRVGEYWVGLGLDPSLDIKEGGPDLVWIGMSYTKWSALYAALGPTNRVVKPGLWVKLPAKDLQFPSGNPYPEGVSIVFEMNPQAGMWEPTAIDASGAGTLKEAQEFFSLFYQLDSPGRPYGIYVDPEGNQWTNSSYRVSKNTYVTSRQSKLTRPWFVPGKDLPVYPNYVRKKTHKDVPLTLRGRESLGNIGGWCPPDVIVDIPDPKRRARKYKEFGTKSSALPSVINLPESFLKKAFGTLPIDIVRTLLFLHGKARHYHSITAKRSTLCEEAAMGGSTFRSHISRLEVDGWIERPSKGQIKVKSKYKYCLTSHANIVPFETEALSTRAKFRSWVYDVQETMSYFDAPIDGRYHMSKTIAGIASVKTNRTPTAGSLGEEGNKCSQTDFLSMSSLNYAAEGLNLSKTTIYNRRTSIANIQVNAEKTKGITVEDNRLIVTYLDHDNRIATVEHPIPPNSYNIFVSRYGNMHYFEGPGVGKVRGFDSDSLFKGSALIVKQHPNGDKYAFTQYCSLVIRRNPFKKVLNRNPKFRRTDTYPPPLGPK